MSPHSLLTLCRYCSSFFSYKSVMVTFHSQHLSWLLSRSRSHTVIHIHLACHCLPHAAAGCMVNSRRPSQSSCQWSLKLLIDHICPRHPGSHRSQSKRRSVRCGKSCPRLPCFVVKRQWSHVHRVLPSPCQSLLKRGSVRTGPSGRQAEPDSCQLEPPLCLSLASELNP